MADFLLGALLGYLLAHYPKARLGAIFKTIESWFL